MYLVLTQDTYFFESVAYILGRQNVTQIKHYNQMPEFKGTKLIIIIDTLMNNVFHTSMEKYIKEIHPPSIYILGPIYVSNLIKGIPVFFLSRTTDVFDFILTINRKRIFNPRKMLRLTRRQHQVLTMIIQGVRSEQIAGVIGVSLKTFYSHKNSIMLSLRLKRISDVFQTKIHDFFIVL